MKIIKTKRELQQFALEIKRSGKTIGFVPTMGYLHAGHMSLIDIARAKADVGDDFSKHGMALLMILICRGLAPV